MTPKCIITKCINSKREKRKKNEKLKKKKN